MDPEAFYRRERLSNSVRGHANVLATRDGEAIVVRSCSTVLTILPRPRSRSSVLFFFVF